MSDAASNNDPEVSVRQQEAPVANTAVPTQLDSTFKSNFTAVGPYQLLQKIAEGGMGEVWLAEQKHPVRRRVALKLIKTGLNSREVVLRFESERQTLALMDHPAIAKVYDAGATPQGSPYFAMEYVPGLPISTFCDNHMLSIRQRVKLFVHVCEGVQHAHQKAIIHRDLKPSNILVMEVNGKPAPKIIDFGVAKALSQRLIEQTMYTRVGSMIGTPEYMTRNRPAPAVKTSTREVTSIRSVSSSMSFWPECRRFRLTPLAISSLCASCGKRLRRNQALACEVWLWRRR